MQSCFITSVVAQNNGDNRKANLVSSYFGEQIYHNIKIAVDIPLLNLEIFLKEAAIFMQPAAYEKRKGNVQK